MDQLEQKLTLTVEHNGKSFTFRRPTVKQMIAADVLGAQLRANVPISALAYGYIYSDYVGVLNTYVTDPKGFDFGELYDDDIVAIYEEVANWLSTFHKPVQKPE